VSQPLAWLQENDIESKPKVVKLAPRGIKRQRATDPAPPCLSNEVSQWPIGAARLHLNRNQSAPALGNNVDIAKRGAFTTGEGRVPLEA
jgi:hypothetical protein